MDGRTVQDLGRLSAQQVRRLLRETLGRGASDGLLLQGGLDDGAQVVGYPFQIRRLTHHAERDSVRGACSKGETPRCRMSHERTPGEHVAGCADFADAVVLWTDPPRGSRRHPGTGHGGPVDDVSDPEVQYAGPLRGQDHVGRFDVAVDHTSRVDRGQRAGCTRGQKMELNAGQRPMNRQIVLQGSAVNVLGGQPWNVGLRVSVQQRHETRTIHSAQHFNFAMKACSKLRVSRVLSMNDLDRDAPPAGIGCRVYGPHAA